MDRLEGKLLHPLTIDCAASSVLIEELLHLNGVPLLLLSQTESRAHLGADGSPHLVQGRFEYLKVAIG